MTALANIPDKFYRVAVKAIVRNQENELLLVKERTDKWSLPGGGLEYGEDPKDAIRRELKEEVGLDVTQIDDDPVYIFSAYNKSFKVWCFTICYNVKTSTLAPTLSADVTEASFVSTVRLELNDFEDADSPICNLIDK